MKKTLVVQVAALGYEFWERNRRAKFWERLSPKPIHTVFPALTCPVQASFRTALAPEKHGVLANGYFDRTLKKSFFWEQSSNICGNRRIWDSFRHNGGTVGQICWQNSIGQDSDMLLSPMPVHKHHGGMIQACYSRPSGLYEDLCGSIGSKFNLFSYWGPFASLKSSRWIVDAASSLLESKRAPDLFLVYIPHLDYALQKHGSESPHAAKAMLELEGLLEKLLSSAKAASYSTLLFGDYAIVPARKAIFPNRILFSESLFRCRTVNGMLYPDIWSSDAFALCDHQVAHVYLDNPSISAQVKKIFHDVDGIEQIHDGNAVSGPNSPDLTLEAKPGFWFAYPWWDKKNQAPDFAGHVDIHSKPGFDPCELFMSLWPPMSISSDTEKVKGTHGGSQLDMHKVFSGGECDFVASEDKELTQLALKLEDALCKCLS